MAMETGVRMSKAPRRRWFQFGLRQLLLLMTTVALASPWLPPAYRHFFVGPCPECGYGPEWPEHSSFCRITCSDITSFVPEPEFKLSREAAALKAQQAEVLQEQD
jgi:hypothetical protein